MMENNELELRAHIRHLLLDYALTHLTTDYVAFTQNAVSELLPDILNLVSTVDPTNPVLEPSIADAVLKSSKSKPLKPYDDQLPRNTESIQYIRTILSPHGLRSIPSSRCWDAAREDNLLKLTRPMSPILTKQSLLETPDIGHKTAKDLTSTSQGDMLKTFQFSKLNVSDAIPLQCELSQDPLNTRLTLEPEVFHMIKSAASSAHLPPTDQHNKWIKRFLRPDTPPLKLPRPISPPIFSRDSSSIGGFGAPHSELPRQFRMETTRDLVEQSFVSEVDISDGFDMDEAHLVVVNGWQAVESTSSPTPSLTSSNGDQIDELFLESSSPAPEISIINRLWESTMDEYELPRAEKIGGGAQPKRLGEGESLSTFLAPAGIKSLPTNVLARIDIVPKIATTPMTQPSSPHTPTTASMIGQTSRLNDDSDNFDPGLDEESGDDLVHLLKDVRGDLDIEVPMRWIINEKLDDKESMFMDVPRLPEPHDHPPNDMYLPSTLTSMVQAIRAKGDDDSRPVSSDAKPGPFLKKVKGLQPLNIELSWVPFNYGTSVPTHEEVTRVLGDDLEKDFYSTSGLDPSHVDKELSRLFSGAAISNLDDSDEDFKLNSAKHWYQEDPELMAKKIEDDFAFVLTAQEIRHLYGHAEPTQDILQDNKIRLDGNGYRDEELWELPLAKRVKLDQRIDYTNTAFDDFLPDESNELDTVYTNQKPSEDSGVFFDDLSVADLDPNDNDGTFAHLATFAEGFNGPRDDGDMFPDLDPILIDSAYPSPIYRPAPSYHSHNNVSKDPDTRQDFPFDVPQTQDFLPLSINSTQRSNHLEAHSQNQQFDAAPPDLSVPIPDKLHDARGTLPVIEEDPALSPRRTIPNATNNPISAKESLAAFLALRSKTSKELEALDTKDTDPPSSADNPTGLTMLQPLDDWQTPSELLDKNTLVLPEEPSKSNSMHTYLTSMDTLLKRGLVRCLTSDTCSVNLVERDQLDGTHFILDPDTSVILIPLLSLPSYCQDLTDFISQLSWRYDHILVLFEAFPTSRYDQRGEEENRGDLNPFSPPVVKSVKKLRRDMNIAGSMGTKKENTTVQYAFATTVKEVAFFVRLYGNLAEGRDNSDGTIWGPRPWLETIEDEENETYVADPPSMNRFVAAMILTQTTLDDFLDCSSEERMQTFGPLVGWERMESFNRTLERRVQFMQLPSSSPAFTNLSSPFLQDDIAAEMQGAVIPNEKLEYHREPGET